MASSRVLIPMLHFYPDHPSGSARLAYDEARFLSGRGHEVWVIAQDASRSKPECEAVDGLKVLRYPTPSYGLFDPRRVQGHQSRTKTLLEHHLKSPVRLVHGHSLLNYEGARELFGPSARMVYSVHSPVALEMLARRGEGSLLSRVHASLGSRLTHLLERKSLEESHSVIADSQYTRTLLGQLHGAWAKEKTKVIPGWVDPDHFKIAPDRQILKAKLGWPREVPVFFTLRRLVPRMGIDLLLRSLREVHDQGLDFRLVIGGEGPLRPKLEALTKTLGLSDRVRFLGLVPEGDLPALYAAADAFLLPSTVLECFGLIVLESLACGRPVLATPVGAIPEVLGRFEPAWIAEEATATALARRIAGFLKGELPAHPPEKLREGVIRHYSRERVLEELTAEALGTREAHPVLPAASAGGGR